MSKTVDSDHSVTTTTSETTTHSDTLTRRVRRVAARRRGRPAPPARPVARARERCAAGEGCVVGSHACGGPPARRVCQAARAVLDALPVGYHLLHPDGRIAYANPRLGARLGSTPEDLVGRTCWEAYSFLADDGLRARYAEAIRAREPRRFVAYVPPLGGWFEFDLYPHREGFMAGCLREVTNERAAEAECARLRREVEMLSEQRRSCLSDLLRCRTDGRLRLCAEPAHLPMPLPDTVADAAAAAAAPDSGRDILHDPSDLAVIPALPHRLAALRERVREAARLARLTPTESQEIAAAASEAAMNAFLHAGGGVAEVRVAPAPGIVQVWVTDRGEGIADEVLRAVANDGECSTVGSLGQGLRLQTALSDLVYLLTGPGGTTVVLERERRAGGRKE